MFGDWPGYPSVYLRFTFTLQSTIILKHVKSGYMTKSLYNFSTFSYFVVHVVMLDLFELC